MSGSDGGDEARREVTLPRIKMKMGENGSRDGEAQAEEKISHLSARVPSGYDM